MIDINGKIVSPKFFTDSTMKIELDRVNDDHITVTWAFDSESELVLLQYVMMYLNDKYPNISKELRMPYAPNARMDRVAKGTEVHTLKYFCKIINSLGFNRVICFDPHSDIVATLLDHYDLAYSSANLKSALANVLRIVERTYSTDYENIVFAYPDKGSVHRYDSAQIPGYSSLPYVYGEKKRNWDTREIVSYSLVKPEGVDLAGKTAVICDDIISSGETILKMYELLKAQGVEKIFVYASHVENEIQRPDNELKKLLKSGDITCLFTTDSIYTGEARTLIGDNSVMLVGYYRNGKN